MEKRLADRLGDALTAHAAWHRRINAFVALTLPLLLLSACSASPSRNILGSYFPSWMICALLGIVGAIAIRLVLVRAGIDAYLPVPLIVYLAFWLSLTLAIWLVWLA